MRPIEGVQWTTLLLNLKRKKVLTFLSECKQPTSLKIFELEYNVSRVSNEWVVDISIKSIAWKIVTKRDNFEQKHFH